MNSSLEFRVWHKPTKTLHLVNFYILDQGEVWVKPKDGATDSEKDYLAQHPFKLEDCIMMQYTGQIDEQLQKVWEGDVLRLDVTSETNALDNYSEFSYVAFYNGCFASFPIGEEITKELFEDLDRWDLLYLTADYGKPLHYQRVACMYELPDFMALKGLLPLLFDPLRPHE